MYQSTLVLKYSASLHLKDGTIDRKHDRQNYIKTLLQIWYNWYCDSIIIESWPSDSAKNLSPNLKTARLSYNLFRQWLKTFLLGSIVPKRGVNLRLTSLDGKTLTYLLAYSVTNGAMSRDGRQMNSVTYLISVSARRRDGATYDVLAAAERRRSVTPNRK